jgi:predicted GIY-YIG superfamily endonuclease
MPGEKRFVYVVKTGGRRPEFYIGATSDVGARLAARNAGFCRYTAARCPWQRHVVIEFNDKSALFGSSAI